LPWEKKPLQCKALVPSKIKCTMMVHATDKSMYRSWKNRQEELSGVAYCHLRQNMKEVNHEPVRAGRDPLHLPVSIEMISEANHTGAGTAAWATARYAAGDAENEWQRAHLAERASE